MDLYAKSFRLQVNTNVYNVDSISILEQLKTNKISNALDLRVNLKGNKYFKWLF